MVPVIAAVPPIGAAVIAVRVAPIIRRRIRRRIDRRGRRRIAGARRRTAEARCDDKAALPLERDLAPGAATAGNGNRRAGGDRRENGVIGARSLPEIDIGIDRGGRRRTTGRWTTGRRAAGLRRRSRRSSWRRPGRWCGLIRGRLRGAWRRLIRWRRRRRSGLRRCRLIGRRGALLGCRGLCRDESKERRTARDCRPGRQCHFAVQNFAVQRHLPILMPQTLPSSSRRLTARSRRQLL